MICNENSSWGELAPPQRGGAIEPSGHPEILPPPSFLVDGEPYDNDPNDEGNNTWHSVGWEYT